MAHARSALLAQVPVLGTYVKGAEHILISRASRKSQLESLKSAISCGPAPRPAPRPWGSAAPRAPRPRLSERGHATQDAQAEPQRLHLPRGHPQPGRYRAAAAPRRAPAVSA